MSKLWFWKAMYVVCAVGWLFAITSDDGDAATWLVGTLVCLVGDQVTA